MARDACKTAQVMTQVPMLVGMIANAWNALELVLSYPAKALLQTNDLQVAKIIMASVGPVQKGDLFRALASSGPFSEEQRAAVATFCTEFDRLRLQRNAVVHGHWSTITADGVPSMKVVKRRVTYRETLQAKDAEVLLAIKEAIDKAASEAFALFDTLSQAGSEEHGAIDAPDD